MEKALKLAVEGGYEIAPKIWGTPTIYRKKTAFRNFELIFPADSPRQTAMRVYTEKIFLDPLFWHALGKSLGWDKIDTQKAEMIRKSGGIPRNIGYYTLQKWYSFIDHLAEGKDAESFFNELLK